MTVEEIIREAWELLGEPTDLDPQDALGAYDLTTEGGSRLLLALNEAIMKVSQFKDAQRRPIFRHRNRIGWQTVELDRISGTTDGSSSGYTVDLDAADFPGIATDSLVGYAVKIGGEVRTVLANDVNASCTLNQKLTGTYASGTAYQVVPRYLTITTSGNGFFEVANVYETENNRRLRQAERGDALVQFYSYEGESAQWYRIGDKVYLDTVQFSEAKRVFRVEFYKFPARVTTLAESPDLPENFHWALVLWMGYWGQQRNFELEEAKNKQRDFVNFMRTQQTEFDVDQDRDPYVGARVYYGGRY